ncbi:AAA family ATPase, partial [Geminocystis sp. GBBB08]|uniref:AAA family ATPase n=1 Tax=Geminocystis sp. GBBB08 TaxID=2604140 RepID=UPI0027E29A63
ISPLSKFRYRAGILYALTEAGENGHCFLPFPELVQSASKILTNDDYEADFNAVDVVILQMHKEEDLIIDNQDNTINRKNIISENTVTNNKKIFDTENINKNSKNSITNNENITFENSTNNSENTIFNPQDTASDNENITLNDPEMAVSLCYKPAFYYSEQHLAKLFNDKISFPAPIPQQWLTKWLNQFTAQNNIELSSQQYKAVLMAGNNRVMILTGGPGCGKTFSTKMIVALWQSLGLTITLAAPTG